MGNFYEYINKPDVKSELEKAISKYRRYYFDKFISGNISYPEAEEFSIKLSRVRAEIDLTSLNFDFYNEKSI